MFELNFFAVVEHTRAALPALKASRGQIVATSSFTGKIGTPVSSTYSATRHALQGYFGALRGEVPEVIYIYVYMYTRARTHTQIHPYAHAHTHPHTHTHTCTDRHTHARTHTHTHTNSNTHAKCLR